VSSALRCHSRRSGPFQLMEGLSPFRRLQDGQSACPLMESVAPPRDQGVMWSPCQPGSSSVPQLEQRPPEARYIATRSAVLKRRRVERLASPREGGVESATSATPHWLSGHSPGSCGSAGLLCVLCGGRGGYFTPSWRLARYHTRVGSVYPEVGFWWAGWFSPKCSSGAATYCVTTVAALLSCRGSAARMFFAAFTSALAWWPQARLRKSARLSRLSSV